MTTATARNDGKEHISIIVIIITIFLFGGYTILPLLYGLANCSFVLCSLCKYLFYPWHQPWGPGCHQTHYLTTKS